MNNLTDTDSDAKLNASTIKKDDSLSNTRDNFSQGEEIIEKIPLFAENIDITKKTEDPNKLKDCVCIKVYSLVKHL